MQGRIARRLTTRRRGGLLALSVTSVMAISVSVAPGAAAAGVAPAAAGARSFSCTGGLGEAFTVRTVTGQLTSAGIPFGVAVSLPGGAVASNHPGRATLVGTAGSSWLHAGFNDWDVTGRNANGDTYNLHIPPVLPGQGGFFDADLEIGFAGGANGSWQIPMFDCSVTGGAAGLALGNGPRSFSCAGRIDVYTDYTVTGQLTTTNIPRAVTVTQVRGGAVVSNHPARATLVGAVGSSWLHTGYNDWDVTGRTANGDLVYLHVPPVLPRAGGFFDADLEIQFAGGANGNVQVPMFDCTVQ